MRVWRRSYFKGLFVFRFFVSRRPPALAPSRAKWKSSRTRRGPRRRGRPRAPRPRAPPAGRAAHVSGPAPAARRATAMPGHGPRTTRRPAGCGRQRPTAGPRPHATPRPRRRPRGTQHRKCAGNEPRNDTGHRAADRKTPTRATASRLIHGGHAHDFMRGRCTHLNNGTHQNNDQICSLDGHQNANMAQANTPVVRHGPGGAVTADATAHNYNVSRRTAIIIYGLASSAGSTLPASCHAGISSHAEHHEAHIHHRA
jgi:hypothetical protein